MKRKKVDIQISNTHPKIADGFSEEHTLRGALFAESMKPTGNNGELE